MTKLQTEDLRWAAIQMLQQYQRSGIGMVFRGTDRLATEWSVESTSETCEQSKVGNNSISSEVPQTPRKMSVAAPAPNVSSPLPAMPMMPLRSGTYNARPTGSNPHSPSLASLQIGEAKWLGPSLPETERADLFATLRDQVVACRKCEELACSRKQTVFGVGKLTPRVVFFGEAPGADEDRIGEPFVGAAGQLLNKIMTASQIRREDVYILNSLKCRPPGNRTPVDSEIENCRSFFEAQLDVLKPEFIVCLGAVAVRAVLQTTESVGRLRGRFHRYRKAQVLVTYHPAYLLRNEGVKKHVWEDMKLLMAAMGLKLPNS